VLEGFDFEGWFLIPSSVLSIGVSDSRGRAGIRIEGWALFPERSGREVCHV
jgi:hypothetical protein